jgi:PAS domain S-box-containing protein
MPEPPAEADAASPESFGIGRLFWLTHEAVIGADLATERIILWNPSAERIFGYTAADAIGMPLDRLVPDGMAGAHHEGIRRFREGGEPRLVGGPPVEVPAVAKDGTVLTIALTLTAVDDPRGRRQVIAVIRDVTAQRAAEEEQRHTFEAMRAFVATASHDLRTPLTAITGFARLLVEPNEQITAEQRADFAASILRSSQQASRLVDDMLTLSKIQAGVIEVRASNVELNAAVAEAASSVGVAVDVDIADGVVVHADSDHLQRILANLLTNATKYGRPPILLTGLTAARRVEVRVCDSGDGISADFATQLFEPFTRAKTTQRQPGAGLGLSIVRGLVEANGGTVGYERADAGGACFVVTLPQASP